jgi:hypothetical protein
MRTSNILSVTARRQSVLRVLPQKPFGYQFSLFFPKRKGSNNHSGPQDVWLFDRQPFTMRASHLLYHSERLIAVSHAKKKPPVLQQKKPQEEGNKRALIWIGAAVAVVFVAVAVLLIVDI